jgi:hypothetical protein
LDLYLAQGSSLGVLRADDVFDNSSDVERLVLYCQAQALELRCLHGKTRSLF